MNKLLSRKKTLLLAILLGISFLVTQNVWAEEITLMAQGDNCLGTDCVQKNTYNPTKWTTVPVYVKSTKKLLCNLKFRSITIQSTNYRCAIANNKDCALTQDSSGNVTVFSGAGGKIEVGDKMCLSGSVGIRGQTKHP